MSLLLSDLLFILLKFKSIFTPSGNVGKDIAGTFGILVIVVIIICIIVAIWPSSESNTSNIDYTDSSGESPRPRKKYTHKECPSCHKSFPVSAKFCPDCGEKLKSKE